VGIATEDDRRRVVASQEDLVRELRRVVRRGLPADRRAAGDVLPNLRNVVARATHPDDVFGRLDALNLTLERLLEDLDDEHLGEAARVLFGVAAGSRGTTLTVRRRQCSALLQYDYDHFRKRVEGRILAVMAEVVHRDLLRYRSRLRRPVTAYETTRPVPHLTAEDLTREEELVCRIWQQLYEVRAERIAVHLAASSEEQQRHRDAEERAGLRLSELAVLYVDTFGKEYISGGELDYAVQGLEKLVVWRLSGTGADSAGDETNRWSTASLT
jgi:hypothetical protein